MIPKINQDLESSRQQKNMTNTQKRNNTYVKEGVIVNSYIKDPLLSLDETCDTLVISNTKIDLPEKIYEKDSKKKNSLGGLNYVAGASLGVMGLLTGFTIMIKNFSKNKYNSSKEYLLPGITRNHCINNEIHQSIFSVIQSPNRKTILASLGVITLGSMAFLGKNFIDGFKDVWIKQKEADIQKNLQENLIEVETQSFSGKIQIIRSMLSSKAKMFSNELSFKNKERSLTIKKDDTETKKLYALGAITIASLLGLGYFSIKNIKKSDEFISKGLKNTREGLKKIINDFNNGKDIGKIEGHNGEIVTGKEAYKLVIENLLESIYAKPEEIVETVNKLKMPTEEKEQYLKHLTEVMNQATEKVNPMMGGSGRNKITYFSHVNDYLSFFYDWLMNPKNPQFKNLFWGIAGISALAYGGKTATEAIKDVQVKKFNAEIELELQKRLVSTELRNFKAKKESAIEPLCEEFLTQKNNGKSREELKIMADNILFEIKNGPPFVYS